LSAIKEQINYWFVFSSAVLCKRRANRSVSCHSNSDYTHHTPLESHDPNTWWRTLVCI